MHRSAARLGSCTIGYKKRSLLPVPAAQRWDLRLARARLWNEYIDEFKPAAEDLEDLRHTSPEFDSFVGQRVQDMTPSNPWTNPANIINRRTLPNHSHLELFARRDLPLQRDVIFAKSHYEKTMHGTTFPSAYRLFKDMQKGRRNDRKLSQNKIRTRVKSGFTNPPTGFQPIPDAGEGDAD